MALEIIKKLDQLVPNQSCIYNVLEPILHSCETPDNITERTRISVGLSICEFSAAHVQFPAICMDPNQLTSCTIQLESKATWWATFSGNYRHISTICNEYQPHFETNKVINTFKNASELFRAYQHEAVTFAQELSMQRQQAQDEWYTTATELTNGLNISLHQLFEFQNEIDNYVTLRKGELNHMSGLADDAIMKLSDVSEQITRIENRNEMFSNFFSDYEAKMLGLLQVNANSTKALSVATFEAEQILMKSGKVLESYNSIITMFAKLVVILVNSSRPLLILGLIAVGYWWWKLKMRAVVMSPEKSKHEYELLSDLLFY